MFSLFLWKCLQNCITFYLSGNVKWTSADRIAFPLLQAPPDLSLVTMVTEAGCPTIHCSRPAPIASLWLATALRKTRVELNALKRKSAFSPLIFCVSMLSPGCDNGPQVVYGLPEPVSLHHQIQLVVLLWLTWQAKAGQLTQPLL